MIWYFWFVFSLEPAWRDYLYPCNAEAQRVNLITKTTTLNREKKKMVLSLRFENLKTVVIFENQPRRLKTEFFKLLVKAWKREHLKSWWVWWENEYKLEKEKGWDRGDYCQGITNQKEKEHSCAAKINTVRDNNITTRKGMKPNCIIPKNIKTKKYYDCSDSFESPVLGSIKKCESCVGGAFPKPWSYISSWT